MLNFRSALISALTAYSVVHTSAEILDFNVQVVEQGKASSYPAKGLLVDENGICIIGLPNDVTIQRIEFEKDTKSEVKLISYDSYARYAFLKLPSVVVEGYKPTSLATTFPEKNVELLGTQDNFLVVGEVGTHNGRVIPFSFRRLHSGKYIKKSKSFPFLTNDRGAVVGMLHSEVLNSSGAFYSVPADVLQKHLLDVRDFAIPTRAWVGVTLDAKIGLPIVKSVRPTSAAAQAGFQKGDIIISIAGKKVVDYNAAVKAFYLLRAEQKVSFQIIRGDEKKSLTFAPKKFPNSTF